MTCRVLQLSRSVIDGGFDYQREVTQAFSGKGFDVTRGRPLDLTICHHYTPAVIVNHLRRLTGIRRMFFLIHDYDYFDPEDYHGRRRNRFVMRSLDSRCTLIAVSEAIRRNAAARRVEVAA